MAFWETWEIALPGPSANRKLTHYPLPSLPTLAHAFVLRGSAIRLHFADNGKAMDQAVRGRGTVTLP